MANTFGIPQLSTGDGGGDIGKIMNFGGGDGGDDDGDDDDYFDDFDDGEEGDEGGWFRRRIVLQEVSINKTHKCRFFSFIFFLFSFIFCLLIT